MLSRVATHMEGSSMLTRFLDCRPCRVNLFDSAMISQVMELRKMRNIVIHGRDHDFDYIDGEKCIGLADKVLTLVNELPKKALQRTNR